MAAHPCWRMPVLLGDGGAAGEHRFAGEQYKVSQEGSQAATTALGAGVLLDWRQAPYDELLRRGGYGDLECRNVTSREEAARARSERLTRLVSGGVFTPNEARAEEGLDPLEAATSS